MKRVFWKRAVALLFCLLLFMMGLPAAFAASMTEYQQIQMLTAYTGLIRDYADGAFMDEGTFGSGYVYADLDGDGFLELLVRTGEMPEDWNWNVYGMRGDDCRYLATFWGANADLYAPAGERGVLRRFLKNGHEIIARITLTGDEIGVETLSDRTVSGGGTALSGLLEVSPLWDIRFPEPLTDAQRRCVNVMNRIEAGMGWGYPDGYFLCDMDGDGAHELVLETTMIEPYSEFDDHQRYTVYSLAGQSYHYVDDVELPLGLSGVQGLARRADGGAGFLRYEAGDADLITLRNGSLTVTPASFPYGEDPMVYYRGLTICPMQATPIPAPDLIPDPGDVDFDFSVTAADARLALRIAVGLEFAEPYSGVFLAADYDCDDVVTAADARLILRRAVGLE